MGIHIKKSKKTKRQKQSKWLNYVFGLIVFIGLGVIAYPTLSNWWNQHHASQAIASYVEQVQQLSDSGIAEKLEKANEYNQKLSYGVDLSLTDEEYAEYESILDITGTGIMGYIEIPSIHVDLPIYHGTSDAVLQIAVGHLAGTSFPVGGKGTHASLSGHRGLPTANLFTNLDELGEGDIFTVTVLDQVYTYQIDQIRIVLPDDTSDLAIVADQDYVTLITCTPYGVNSHRMLVRGRRIATEEAEAVALVVSEATRISPTYVICGIAIPLIMIAMLLSFLYDRLRAFRKPSKKLLDELEEASQNINAGGNENEK